MTLIEITNKSDHLIAQLLDIWERSVKTTHHFLSDHDIDHIKNDVPQAITNVDHLIIAENNEGHPLAFMGIEKDMLEMLFIAPEGQKKGLGKCLIQYGLEHYAIKRVTVNEQNTQTRGFYEHMGFHVYKRTDFDEQGNPYPLLYMCL